VTLPEVVMSQLVEKFDEFSLYNQITNFDPGSDSNSSSMSPWIEPHELAPESSCQPVLPHEHFPYDLRNTTTAYVDALVPHRAGKEIASEYSSDYSAVPDYNSETSYEFNFGSDLIKSEFELNTTEEPQSGPAASLVITSTPAGRFVYYLDSKPANLTDDNSRCITYLETLPLQEGTPLAPNEDEHTPTEVATTDYGLPIHGHRGSWNLRCPT
jgi:hypothetical protein